MIMKIVYAPDEKNKEVLSSIGCEGYNDAPSNFRIAHVGDVMKSHFTSHTPKYMFRRSVYAEHISQKVLNARYKKILAEANREYLRPEKNYMENCYASIQFFVYHDGTGIGIEHLFWEQVLIWYAFGCVHDYRELSVSEAREHGIPHFGMCYHVSECQKCGHINARDSSD